MKMSMAESLPQEELSLRSQYAYAGALIFYRDVFEEARKKLEENILSWRDEEDQYLMRETGAFAAFLVTKEVWEHAAENEQDAKKFNDLLLKYFAEGHQIVPAQIQPYAKASMSDAWIMLYGSRVAKTFSFEDAVLVFELNQLFTVHLEGLMKSTKDAFHLPISEIKARMDAAFGDPEQEVVPAFGQKSQQGKAPYTVVIIDLLDAYVHADVFDNDRYAFVGKNYTDLGYCIALADRLFSALNPKATTQPEWSEQDAGHDVRIYDADFECLYKGHEKFRSSSRS